jgi:hypothetical protein
VRVLEAQIVTPKASHYPPSEDPSCFAAYAVGWVYFETYTTGMVSTVELRRTNKTTAEKLTGTRGVGRSAAPRYR